MQIFLDRILTSEIKLGSFCEWLWEKNSKKRTNKHTKVKRQIDMRANQQTDQGYFRRPSYCGFNKRSVLGSNVFDKSKYPTLF